MAKLIENVNQLKEFMKSDKFEYEPVDIQVQDGIIWLRFIIKKRKYWLVGLVSVDGCFTLNSLNDIESTDTNDSGIVEEFIDFFSNIESFRQFRKNVFGELNNKNVQATGFQIYDEDKDDVIGYAIFNFDTKKLDFFKE